MTARCRRAGLASLFIACAAPVTASANGRLPGATALSIGPGDAAIVVRATYGMVESPDAGQSWRWICEQAIGVSGESDPPLALTNDGTWILVSPKGGLLVSHDRGCTWNAGPAVVAGKRTVDLSADPSSPSRVVVLASTVDTIDDKGLVSYENLVAETRDDGKTWTALGPLPPDVVAETVELSPSDPLRIYVSGTASDNPLQGVILRSEDGGGSWQRASLGLPSGSGSVFISAIDPHDANRLWIRVPARGDTYGLFPASLLTSDDKGEHFTVIASTARAMFGLALSPDGSRLAYGGPFDGLYVGPSAGGSFEKVSDLGVRCLKWRGSGLYACASQPSAPFTLGLSPNGNGIFEPLYDARTTCPRECPAGGDFALACKAPWAVVGPVVGAGMCAVPWGEAGPMDAGTIMDAGTVVDAEAGSNTGGRSRSLDGSSGGASGGARPNDGGTTNTSDSGGVTDPDSGVGRAGATRAVAHGSSSCELARTPSPAGMFLVALGGGLAIVRRRTKASSGKRPDSRDPPATNCEGHPAHPGSIPRRRRAV